MLFISSCVILLFAQEVALKQSIEPLSGDKLQMAKSILVVDDSATIRTTVTMALDQDGYRSVEAVDGLDALGKLDEYDVDMIITDINMPNMDGFGLIREARKASKTKFTPIVVLTTETSEELKSQGRAAGASGWIEKPFNPTHLLKMVQLTIG